MEIVGCSPDSFRVFVVLFCLPLAAQDPGGLQPRQLYYKSKSALETEQKTVEKGPDKGQATKSTTGSGGRHRLKTTASETHNTGNKGTTEPGPLGLKYIVEREDASGKHTQVDADSTFRTGEAIRFRIEVNSDAYVYLVARGASGDGNFLFPMAGEDNRLKAFQSVQVPAEPADPIRFDEPAGTETLYILVSRSPVPDLDRLLPARGLVASAKVPRARLDQIADRMQSRDLVRGKVTPSSNAGPADVNETAAYAVNVSKTPGAQVLQKLDLKHR